MPKPPRYVSDTLLWQIRTCIFPYLKKYDSISQSLKGRWNCLLPKLKQKSNLQIQVYRITFSKSKDKCHQRAKWIWLHWCGTCRKPLKRSHLCNLLESKNKTNSANIEGFLCRPLQLGSPVKTFEEYWIGFTFLSTWSPSSYLIKST